MPMVDPSKIGSWEGAVLEHSRTHHSALRAPLRDPSKEDGLPSLCSAIDMVEGQQGEGDAMGAGFSVSSFPFCHLRLRV